MTPRERIRDLLQARAPLPHAVGLCAGIWQRYGAVIRCTDCGMEHPATPENNDHATVDNLAQELAA